MYGPADFPKKQTPLSCPVGYAISPNPPPRPLFSTGRGSGGVEAMPPSGRMKIVDRIVEAFNESIKGGKGYHHDHPVTVGPICQPKIRGKKAMGKKGQGSFTTHHLPDRVPSPCFSPAACNIKPINRLNINRLKHQCHHRPNLNPSFPQPQPYSNPPTRWQPPPILLP